MSRSRTCCAVDVSRSSFSAVWLAGYAENDLFSPVWDAGAWNIKLCVTWKRRPDHTAHEVAYTSPIRMFKCLFKKVGLRCCVFFCESHCQGCVKWWQLANCVAGVGHRESVILRGRRSIWDNFVISINAFRTGTAACGVMLPSSFVPFCVAGRMLVYAATCHLRRDPLHSTFHTFHYYIEHFTCLSTFCTPYFALRTLQCTVDIPHPQSTLYSTIYTLQSALYTPHFNSALNAQHFALHTLHFRRCTPHTLHITLYTSHFTRCTPNSTLYTLHFALDTPHSTLDTPHFAPKLYTLHSILYTLHSTIHTPQSPLHTLRTTFPT